MAKTFYFKNRTIEQIVSHYVLFGPLFPPLSFTDDLCLDNLTSLVFDSPKKYASLDHKGLLLQFTDNVFDHWRDIEWSMKLL